MVSIGSIGDERFQWKSSFSVGEIPRKFSPMLDWGQEVVPMDPLEKNRFR